MSDTVCMAHRNNLQDWLTEEDLDLLSSFETETYQSRTTGKSYRTDPAKGDGYWCPRHENNCTRSCEDRRWGKFGAAGILFYHRESQTFLLNQRSKAIHFGETWSTLGGAVDRDEDTFDGAMREVEEEIGQVPPPYWMVAQHESVTKGEHSDWMYTTFVVEVTDRWTPTEGDWESMGNEWVSLTEMATMKLHPGFRGTVHDLVAQMYNAGAFRR